MPGGTAPAGDSGRTRLETWLRRRGLAEAKPAPLVRDAGERMYFRIERPGRDPVVVCLMGAPFAPGSLPFANSTALYGSLGVAVPEILDEAPDLGVVLLEDLGDELLQHRAIRRAPDLGDRYGDAVDILARIQREGERIGNSDDASAWRAWGMRLDAPLFLRELRFFRRHFLEGRLDSRVLRRTEAWLDRFFVELADEAAGTPSALCHRDYHSRNLMLRPNDGRLVVIDHQDTRIGPRGYDIMSLARDPYVRTDDSRPPFDEGEVAARFADAACLSASRQELAAEYDTVALQRLLKALGTYGHQVNDRDNPVYARYIAPTLAMVREILDRAPPQSPRRELATILEDIDPS